MSLSISSAGGIAGAAQFGRASASKLDDSAQKFEAAVRQATGPRVGGTRHEPHAPRSLQQSAAAAATLFQASAAGSAGSTGASSPAGISITA